MNLRCKVIGASLPEIAGKINSSSDLKQIRTSNKYIENTYSKSKVPFKIQNWFIALLLIFALSIIGIGISIFYGILIPFWLLLGFACIFTIEKWFGHYTGKHYKWIGKLYRLFLNLSILSLLGLLIWTSFKLFSQQFFYSPLVTSLIFIAEIILFIWLWRVVSRNSWRWPSMKITVLSLVGLCLIFAFAGVSPISIYKDNTINWFSKLNLDASNKPENSSGNAFATNTQSNKSNSSFATINPTSVPTTSASKDSSNINITQLEKQIHDLINTQRAKNGLTPLNWDSALSKIASMHSQDMASRNYFEHDSPGGQTFSDRYKQAGYQIINMSAENIFQGWLYGTSHYTNGILTSRDYYTTEQLAVLVVNDWMASPGHKINILTPRLTNEGIGVAISTDGKIYVTEDFAG